MNKLAEYIQKSHKKDIYRRLIQMIAGMEIFSMPKLKKIRVYLFSLAFKIGEKAHIGAGVRLERRHTRKRYLDRDIKIGRGVLLGQNCSIDYTGGVELRDNVKISAGACIFSHSHKTEDNAYTQYPQMIRLHKVIIDENAWIGEQALILSSVSRIGKNAVVGAGSVVGHDVPDYAMVSGNPARIIGYVQSRKGKEREQ